MNIDVREYLRINPISTHKETMSEYGDDCFVLFNEQGIDAITQNDLFLEFYNNIFYQLIDNSNGLRFRYSQLGETIEWEDGVELDDRQFSDRARRSEYQDELNKLNEFISEMESDIELLEEYLKQYQHLNYSGAVELMSKGYVGYQDFLNAIGHIWCYGSLNPVGLDEVELSKKEIPLHTHPNSKVESTTDSITTKFGGGNTIGNTLIGQMTETFQSDTVSARQFNVRNVDEQYYNTPLSGLNILDLRIQDRGHTNIPPSYNIYIKYKGTGTSRNVVISYSDALNGQVRRMARAIDGELSEDTQDWTMVEPQYKSHHVSELVSFSSDDYSNNDYMLRLCTESGDVELTKQKISNLMEIFCHDALSHLSAKDEDGKWHKIDEILKAILDKLLVSKFEYSTMFRDRYAYIEELGKRISKLSDEFRHIQPITYVGRIIMSVTDDTEQKVIANYGGRRWKRVVNFLRGVETTASSPNDALGNRIGEQYVCLRESNIPDHTHKFNMNGTEVPNKLGSDGVDMHLISNQAGTDSSGGVKLSRSTVDWQASPLEYNETEYKFTIPHNNMPQYEQVYIWECVEADIDESQDQGESYFIYYNMNGNGNRPAGALTNYSSNTILPYTPPNALNVTGFTFTRWEPSEISVNTTGPFTFNAIWERNTYKVNFYDFDGNLYRTVNVGYKNSINELPTIPSKAGYNFYGWLLNGKPFNTSMKITQDIDLYPNSEMVIYTVRFLVVESLEDTYSISETTIMDKYGQFIQASSIDNPSLEGHTFNGWVDESGNQITFPYKIIGNATYKSTWNKNNYTVTFNSNGGSAPNPNTVVVEYESTVQNLPSITKTGHTSNGWETQDGQPFSENTPVTNDITVYAKWIANQYTITFDSNGGTPVNNMVVTYDSQIGILPTTTRTGYNTTGWYMQNGSKATETTRVYSNITLTAKWEIMKCFVTFDGNGSNETFEQVQVDYGQRLNAPASPTKNGYTFRCWYLNGSEYDFNSTITSNITLVAQWNANTYTITWKPNNGQADTTTSAEYGSILTPPTCTYAGYVLDGWYTGTNGSGTKLNSNSRVTGDATYYAKWNVQVITEVTAKQTTAFATKRCAWIGPYTTQPISTHKWIGSSRTTNWIAYQPAHGDYEICTRIHCEGNKEGRYFYYPGELETAYTNINNRSTRYPLSSNVMVGVGGYCLEKITPTYATATRNILITRIKFSPYAASKSDYSSYSGTRVPEYIEPLNGVYQKFKAYLTNSGTTPSLLSVGNKFIIRMYLSNGQTIEKTHIDNTFTGIGWRTINSTTKQVICDIDFSQSIKDMKLPVGTYTTSVTFETENTTANKKLLGILINGMIVYSNN